MERASSEPVFVGIDVAKDRLDVHLRPSAETFAVARDGPGLAALAERLAAAGPSLARGDLGNDEIQGRAGSWGRHW